MNEPIIAAWKKSGLAQAISDERLNKLLSKASFRLSRVHKGDIYAVSGDRVSALQIVIEGELHAEMVGPSGKQILIDQLDHGRILAPALIFATENILPVTLIAEQETSVYVIGREEFKRMMHEEPVLMENYLRIVANIAAFLAKKIRQLSLRSLQGKISDYLLRCHREEGNKEHTISVRSSWKELADSFGVNRQSLARSLAQMEEAGLIRTEGKKIHLLQIERIAQIE